MCRAQSCVVKWVDDLVIDAELQVANNRTKALQMLLQAEELEAILARDNSHTADHIQLFSEVCSPWCCWCCCLLKL